MGDNSTKQDALTTLNANEAQLRAIVADSPSRVDVCLAESVLALMELLPIKRENS
jgi:hypothetical protein